MILLVKTWDDPLLRSDLATDLPLAERILLARGVSDASDRAAFLSETTATRHDPFLLPDMEKACERIRQAIGNREKILIFGDYDADGVTATALMLLFLRRAGADCEYLIPDRVSEGYGMSESLFAKIAAHHPSLMITVDCGISDVHEVATLSRSGIDVIVTDHHEVKPILPPAYAIVSAKRTDSEYPFPYLSGVGIALKLAQALSSVLYPITDKEDWKEYLDLAMIGTVADVVPLTDENRRIVRQGIHQTVQCKRVGVAALTEAAGQTDKTLSAVSISYLIVPRINASGRMGDAARAVELLTTKDAGQAREIATLLSEENAKRQEIELKIFTEAVSQIEKPEEQALAFGSFSPIVVLGEDWHPGVIGIVASRLVARYSRPAIVFTRDSGQSDLLKGSARSVEGFNILEAIIYCKEFTAQYGGHPKAAGISLEAKAYSRFVEKLREYSAGLGDDLRDVAVLRPDACLTAREITLGACHDVMRLAPFGEGNPEPCFILRGASVEQTMSCGNGRHLKMKISCKDPEEDKTFRFDGIAFGFGMYESLFCAGDTVDILFALSATEWKGRESLSLMIRDIRFAKSGNMAADTPEILEKLYRNRLGMKQLCVLSKLPRESLLPSKDDFKRVYQFLRTNCVEGITICDVSLLARYISASYNFSLNGFALLRILDVFEEAGLLRIHERSGQRICFSLLFVDGKVKLENTDTYQRIFSERE